MIVYHKSLTRHTDCYEYHCSAPNELAKDIHRFYRIHIGYVFGLATGNTAAQSIWMCHDEDLIRSHCPQVSSLECINGSAYYQQLGVVMIIPAIITLCYIAVFILSIGYTRSVFEKSSDRRRLLCSLKHTIRRSAVFMIFLLYPKVSSSIISLYSCKNVEGTYYLRADMRVICDRNGKWYGYAVSYIPFLIIYPIVVPLILFWSLWKQRNKLHYAKNLIAYGIIYRSFDEGNWFLEAADMFHKLIVTGVIQLLPLSAQIPFAIFVSTAYFAFILWRRPYKNPELDTLHLHVQCFLVSLLYCGHLARKRIQRESSLDTALGVLFIMITLSIFLLVMMHLGKWLYHARKWFAEEKAMMKKGQTKDNPLIRVGSTVQKGAKQQIGFLHRENTGVVMSRNPIADAHRNAKATVIDGRGKAAKM